MHEWSCQLCSSTFSRPEHLKRHSVSHDNARPHVCGSCRNSFNRSDSLRRHERTCKLRDPETETYVGDDSHSYSDDVIKPKRRCYSMQTEGFAPFIDPDISPSELPTTLPDSMSGQGISYANHHAQSNQADESNLIFNHTFTNSKFSDPFLNSEQDLLQNIPSPLDFSALDLLFSSQITTDIVKAEKLEYLAYFTSTKGMSTFTDRETFQWSQRMVADAYEEKMALIDSPETNLELDLLTTKAIKLRKALREAITNKRNNDVIKFDWSPTTSTQCEEFFSPANIHRFLEYFWSLWYPNCPIVHKPLFKTHIASDALLCVMILIGACLSPTKPDAQSAQQWLDSAEELIFGNECFRDTQSSKDKPAWKKERLQAIQAGYLICSLQKREGPAEAQSRIRRYRHASMVTLARNIGIAAASHRNLDTNQNPQAWWRQFAEEEELLRTIIFVFLIDAALVIFHNSPPRVVVSELKMDVSCPEACFQAESATECLSHLEEWTKTRFWKNRLSVVSVLRQICQKELDDESVREFSQLGTLNLFTMVQSIHSLMFHLQNSLVFETTLAPVQTGLENWRRIWDQRVPEDADNPLTSGTLWKQIGFLRQASEFWHLARIKSARIISSAEDDFEDGTLSSSRYDHTDMGDVNGLIMEYRRMNLGMT